MTTDNNQIQDAVSSAVEKETPTKTYRFYVDVKMGDCCCGMGMDETIDVDVALTDDEVRQIKAFVKRFEEEEAKREEEVEEQIEDDDCDDEYEDDEEDDYSDNALFSRMSKDLPDIYDKIEYEISLGIEMFYVKDGIDNNYYEDEGWSMFMRDLHSGKFVPEKEELEALYLGDRSAEDLDVKALDENNDDDHEILEQLFDIWDEKKPAIGDKGWDDYYEERYKAISDLSCDIYSGYSVNFPSKLL